VRQAVPLVRYSAQRWAVVLAQRTWEKGRLSVSSLRMFDPTFRTERVVHAGLVPRLHPSDQPRRLVPPVPSQETVVLRISQSPDLAERLLGKTGCNEEGESILTGEDASLNGMSLSNQKKTKKKDAILIDDGK